MNKVTSKDWPTEAKAAIALQQSLKSRVILQSQLALKNIRTVAGVDVGFEQQGQITRAAIVVLNLQTLQPIDQAVARAETCFPYIPGLLSFRELPTILEAYNMLRDLPDVLLCDGQGYAHPRRFGLACHLGVELNKPTIGVGKTRLCGQFALLGQERGNWTALIDKGETIGAALRSRAGCLPIFISPGHLMNLTDSIDLVMRCTRRYKLPETTRHAHHLASVLKDN